MQPPNDPFLAGARALKHALETGQIGTAQYDEMYAALAAAAEQDAQACEVPGCERAAYIGRRCAAHTSIDDVRRKVRDARHV